MTNEEIAVNQFMSRKGYESYSGGCCCIGAKIDVENDSPYKITITKSDNVDTLLKIRSYLDLSLAETLDIKKGKPLMIGKHEFAAKHKFETVCNLLNSAGVEFEADDTTPIYFPACPCGMNYFERVDGKWYQIHKVAEATKISFDAQVNNL
jgi:hypothetical protein